MPDKELDQADVVENISRLFAQLGATPEQAKTMARQLWKRSLQIAQERDVKQVVALNELLSLAVTGSQGMGPQDLASDQG